MEYRKLGDSEVEVSVFALGSMTFGGQNNAAEAHAQLDCACAAGINLIDSAEIYPAPATAAASGEAERIIGQWLKRRGGRAALVLATKAAGPAAFLPWIRTGASRHDAANLSAAVDGSLARLGTDYIDLFQLHWPDRASNFFGGRGFTPARSEQPFDIAETLGALARLRTAGKIREVGLCNETPWGVAEFLRLAAGCGLPRIVSVQNACNLLDREFEQGLAEFAWRERLSLLAYAPLAGGTLSGKYRDGTGVPGARLTLHPAHYRHYATARAAQATARYLAIAAAHQLDPVHMALAFVASKPYVASVIIGATSVRQLEHDLAAAGMRLPRTVLRAIDAVHQEIPNPCR